MDNAIRQEQSIWNIPIERQASRELHFGITHSIHPLSELDAINNRDEYQEQLHKVIDDCHELNKCNYKDLHQASFNVVHALGLVWTDEVTRLIIEKYILDLLSYKKQEELPNSIDADYLSDLLPCCYLGIIFNVVRYRAYLNILDTEIRYFKIPYIIYKEGEPYLIVDTPDRIRDRLNELGIEIKK